MVHPSNVIAQQHDKTDPVRYARTQWGLLSTMILLAPVLGVALLVIIELCAIAAALNGWLNLGLIAAPEG